MLFCYNVWDSTQDLRTSKNRRESQQSSELESDDLPIPCNRCAGFQQPVVESDGAPAGDQFVGAVLRREE